MDYFVRSYVCSVLSCYVFSSAFPFFRPLYPPPSQYLVSSSCGVGHICISYNLIFNILFINGHYLQLLAVMKVNVLVTPSIRHKSSKVRIYRDLFWTFFHGAHFTKRSQSRKRQQEVGRISCVNNVANNHFEFTSTKNLERLSHDFFRLLICFKECIATGLPRGGGGGEGEYNLNCHSVPVLVTVSLPPPPLPLDNRPLNSI